MKLINLWRLRLGHPFMFFLIFLLETLNPKHFKRINYIYCFLAFQVLFICHFVFLFWSNVVLSIKMRMSVIM